MSNKASMHLYGWPRWSSPVGVVEVCLALAIGGFVMAHVVTDSPRAPQAAVVDVTSVSQASSSALQSAAPERAPAVANAGERIEEPRECAPGRSISDACVFH
jgi:hypothetical protein